jgi:ribose transport system permease protein
MKIQGIAAGLVGKLRPGGRRVVGEAGEEAPAGEHPREGPKRSRQQRLLGSGEVVASEYGTVIALVIIILVFSIMSPDAFFTFTNMREVLTEAAPLVVLSVGLTIVAMVSEFDLSIGYTASYTCLLSAGLMSMEHIPALAAVIVVLVVGAGIGLVNGILVARVGVNSVIATLGMGSVVLGLNYAYTDGAPVVGGISPVFLGLATDSYGGIPLYVLIGVVVVIGALLMLRFSRFGQEIQAVGGNPEAARLAGVRVMRARTGPFVVCGVLAAVTGMMITSLIGSGASDAGDSYLLSAFAAVFLGSATFHAGRFNITGTVVGVLIIQIVFDGLAIFGQPTFVENLLTGGILIVAVSMSSVGRRLLAR